MNIYLKDDKICCTLENKNAKFYRIEGWELVNEILTQIRPKYDIVRKKLDEEAEKIDKEKVWSYIQKNGCGKCAYLIYDVDVPICGYAVKRLKDKPKGTWTANGKCYLMYGGNTVYPCEECLHNPKNEEKKENEKR